MDYFLAELIAKMGERLLVMQAPCGDQTRAMLCSNAGVAKGAAHLFLGPLVSSLFARHFVLTILAQTISLLCVLVECGGSQGRLESGIFHGSTSNTKKVLCRGSDRGIFQIQTSIGNP